MDYFTAAGCLYLFYCLGMKKLKILEKNKKRAKKYTEHVLREDTEYDDEYDEEEDEVEEE